MLHNKLYLLITASLFLGLFSCKQQKKLDNNNLSNFINNTDISNLWMAETKFDSTPNLPITPVEPIGFIGRDYQRFYIHFDSIIKNKNNPLLYEVFGRRKIDKSIRQFKGYFKIDTFFKQPYEYGFDSTDNEIATIYTFVHLKEDSIDTESGEYIGQMITHAFWKFHKQAVLASLKVGDASCSNQTETNFTNYYYGWSEKCNWGIERIPDCGDLDQGAGEFSTDTIYDNKGWKFYSHMYNNQESKEFKDLLKEEFSPWW